MKIKQFCLFYFVFLMFLFITGQATEILAKETNNMVIQQVVEQKNKELWLFFAQKKGIELVDLENPKKEDFDVKIDKKSVLIEKLVKMKDNKEYNNTEYLLLVDISKSLDNTQLQKMKDFLNAFSDKVLEENCLSLVTFGEDFVIKQSFNSEKNTWRKSIESLTLSDNQTRLFRAIVKAVELFDEREKENHKVVILLTDGRNDATDGIGKTEALQKIASPNLTFYVVGCGNEEKDTLKELAEKAKGSFFSLNAETPLNTAEKLFEDLQKTWLIKILDYEVVNKRNDDLVSIELFNEKNKEILGDGVEVKLAAKKGSGFSLLKYKKRYLILGAIVIILVIAGIFIWLLKKRDHEKLEMINLQKKAENSDKNFKKEAMLISQSKNIAGTVLDEQSFKSSGNVLSQKMIVPPQEKTAGKKFYLALIGSQKKVEFFISQKIIIGKGKNCELILLDNSLAEEECALYLKGKDTFYIEPLKSKKSRVLVNGIEIDRICKLEKDDLLVIGRGEYRIVAS